MGEIVGYVTRSTGAPGLGFSLDSEGTNGISRNSFVGTKADGTICGSGDSVRKAQRAVETSLGGAPLKWTRVEMSGQIERYEGRETRFSPGDYGRLLEDGAWLRSDRGILSYPASSETLIRRWASPVDRGVTRAEQATAADQPSSVAVANAGRPAVRFAAAATEFMTTNLSIGAVAAGMSVFVVGTWRTAGRDQVMVQTTDMRMLVNAAGNFVIENDTDTVVGPAATEGAPFVLHGLWPAVVGVFTPSFYLNGVLFDTSVDMPAASLLSISDAVDSWHEDIQEILAIPRAMVENQAERFVNYAIRRYQITV